MLAVENLTNLIQGDQVLTLIVFILAMSQFFLARRQRIQHARQAEMLNRKIQDMEAQLTAMNHGAVGVGKRLIRIEQLMHSSLSDHAKVKQVSGISSEFDLAAQLSAQGASVNDIVHKTGLSRPEAELVRLLNGKAVEGHLAAAH